MSELERLLHCVISCFEALGLEYAVMGGLAVRVHAIPRPTYDADFILAIDRNQLPRLFESVQEIGLTVAPPYLSGWVDKVAEMPLVKFRAYVAEETGIDVDVFLAETDFQRNVIQNRMGVEVNGKSIQVVTAEDLLLLKLLASRPRDLIDVADLIFIQGELDSAYLRRWATSLGIIDRLEAAFKMESGGEASGNEHE
ncbi:MAG: nucleotidyl transferase AbiEii/AbiGii toxin family protein [Planctomycetota bacterium]